MTTKTDSPMKPQAEGRTEPEMRWRMPPPLTPREKECLRWALLGKSAWETGEILGISQHTVAKMLQTARAKLDAPNKQAAARYASMLGLLDEPPALR